MTQHSMVPGEQEFFALTDLYLSPEERRCVAEAYQLARKEHGDDRRRSGELFITHPLTVARYLAEYQADAASLTAALLHDVAEDTKVSLAEIEARFGPEVARLVDGLTKFEAVTEDVATPRMSKEQLQTATLHKLFAMMAADYRIGVIKLFDRLHNMRTIDATPPESQRRKAKETLAVYAPLADRLGIWWLRNELGESALAILYAEEYRQVKQQLEQVHHQQQTKYALVSQEVMERLQQAGLQADVMQNPESIYSIFSKGWVNGRVRNHIDETLRVVVQLEDVPSCYLALGYIHQLWPPVPQRFDDYIARPRDNLYSSLHTTVTHPKVQRVKVRFRTRAMNVLSEIGVLARWVDIKRPIWSEELAERVQSLTASIQENIELEPQNFGAGVQNVVEDVFRRQILVYTPRSDVKQLPLGATPVDFAYHIHTDVGNQCHAARVNGQRFPLNRPLSDGDRVEIEKKESHTPQRTWLDEDLGYTATRYARTSIRRWFRRLPTKTAVDEGRALVEREMRLLGLTSYPHQELARLLGYAAIRPFYHDVGRAEVLPTALSTMLLEQHWHRISTREVGQEVQSAHGQRYVVINTGGRSVRLCRICEPRPDDPIFGFIRSDRRVTIHREICPVLPANHSSGASGRLLKPDWGVEGQSLVRLVKVKVDVYDRPNLLLEISLFLSDENINIHTISTPIVDNVKSILLELEMVTARQVVRILHRIQALVNVYDVTCLNFITDADDLAGATTYLPE